MSSCRLFMACRKRVRHCVMPIVNGEYAAITAPVSPANAGPHLYASMPAEHTEPVSTHG